MAKAQLKILAFLITVGLVAGTLSVAWWFYTNVLLKEHRLEQDIAAMKGKDRPRLDPGLRRFDAAVDLIRAGKIDEGRDALYKLRQQFPDSAACPEAIRIIGEINLDMLYSPKKMAGKKDYIVQPGNTLLGIAVKNDTTIDSIIRMNGLMSTLLHPGDHLTVMPLDFNLGVSASKKQVMLLRKVGEKEFLFKVYEAKDIRLPATVRVPAEVEITGKNAQLNGKNLLATDEDYPATDKWLSGTRGVLIRTPPAPKALPVPPPSKDGSMEPVPDLQDSSETGIFLSREDIEELFALVRKGAKLSLVR